MSDENDLDAALSEEEAADLDTELSEAIALRQEFPLARLPFDSTWDKIARTPGLDVQKNKPLTSKMGLSPRTAVQLIDNALDMLEAARGMVMSHGQAIRYRTALRALQVDRRAAWEAALDLTAPRYAISAQLRAQAEYLRSIHTKLKNDTAAIANHAAALNGTATLIQALVA